MHPAIAEGIRLFNSRRFFEAHEALEALWLKEQGEEKLFLHGLIQVAAAFHHLQRKNPEGFRRVLAKGMRKLEQFSGTHGGIEVDTLKLEIKPWEAFTGDDAGVAQTLPIIQVRASNERQALPKLSPGEGGS
jgi:hypothetical protein